MNDSTLSPLPIAGVRPGALIAPLPPGGFSGRAVPRALIDEILNLAARAPSGVNTQPWNVTVLTGAALAPMVAQAFAQVPALAQDAAQRAAFWQTFETHPLVKDWNAKDVASTADAAFSEAMALCTTQPAKAQAALERYFRFFDAPVGLFFTLHSQLGLGAVLDTGMFVQNIVLAAQARGVRAVVQTGWRGLGDQVVATLAAPPAMWLVCGMALGFDDAAQPPVEGAITVPDMQSRITWHE